MTVIFKTNLSDPNLRPSSVTDAVFAPLRRGGVFLTILPRSADAIYHFRNPSALIQVLFTRTFLLRSYFELTRPFISKQPYPRGYSTSDWHTFYNYIFFTPCKVDKISLLFKLRYFGAKQTVPRRFSSYARITFDYIFFLVSETHVPGTLNNTMRSEFDKRFPRV